MVYRHSFQLLSILASTWTIFASQHANRHVPRATGSTTLRPISIVNYEAAIGLQRRDSEEFSGLNLQTQSDLIYGSPGDNGQLHLANMTLYAPDGLLMIMMERFEGLTSSVDCKGDDGTMSLTFKSENAFKRALQEWSFINENDDGKFLLIANHDGCGPDDERQPYLISKVTEDTEGLTTYLTAQPAPWSDVAGKYNLDFGQSIPYQKPHRFRERGLWGDIVNVGKDVLDAATGSADISKTVSFPVNVGQKGQRTNIYTDNKGRLKLDCINCFVTGSFEVTGHISVDHFELQDLTLTASPQAFEAELELEATITSTDKPDSLQYTKELFSAPVPGAGIAVSGIFKLGATLSYDIGVSSSFSGSATVDFGLQAGLPDNAKLIADVQNPDSSSATGFGGGSLNPIFDITKESASIKLAAFSQPKLAFGIELIEIGDIDVALTIKLPEVSVTLAAAYDEAGVCSQSAGASKTGVKLDSEVDLELDLQIDASLGDQSSAKPSWSKKLWGVTEPLLSKCFPLDIPGLSSKDTTASTSTAVGASSLAASGTKASSASPSSSLPVVPSSEQKATVHPTTSTLGTSYEPAATSPSTADSMPSPKDPSSMKEAPTTTTKPTAAAPAQTSASSTITSSAESGGGGCRMVKRFGKRMLIC